MAIRRAKHRPREFWAPSGSVQYSLGAGARTITSALQFAGGAALLLGEAAGYTIRGRIGLRRTIEQVLRIGYDSMPVALTTLLFAGMVLSLQTAKLFVEFGATAYLGGMVAVSIARELGPVLTGVVVAARVGSAMAAKLGSMKITEQIDALRALATSPVHYLVVPRLLAGIVALPLLAVYTELAGGLGALVVAMWQGVTPTEYILSVRRHLQSSDVFGGLAKTAVFGLLISLVSCWYGLTTRGGAEGVGRSTTAAVVASIVLIYVANYFMSWLILATLG